MKLIIKLLYSSLLLFLLLSLFISDGVYTVYSSRNVLLQTEKFRCPIDFQNLNYKIIRSRCKGPLYPPQKCCLAFKKLACPYSGYLNDEGTDCLTLLFSDIKLYGGYYPVGLFENICLQGRQHIDCP
ncbi:LORELEI-LIKE-GPI-ANCHORED PROTEIN 1 [Raphanus sativus]|uniref:GPI-anchored protein LLG1-like n=1 Tax=Raphanus sativus TaxID=3726 RepID=A0A9W3CMS9_RAPSA|nr:GPI-anchored protein LLG1-like [Raphanus sativus]KAJ4872355.1 LORELEI-LIKE-GPI-ANCHORED PROTEIN 1 [Raphanus sativus]